MAAFDFITASAVSFVVGGNTGVSPFLTLLICGIVGHVRPDLLNMSGFTELLASWPSMIALGIFTALEFIAKCIPVLDEVVDSLMTVVVPAISVVGSLSTFGLFQIPAKDESSADYGTGERRLSAFSGFLCFWKFFLLALGIILALSMHAVKMLVRLIGLGWLTTIMAVLEVLWVLCTILVALFVRPISIFIAALIGCTFLFQIKKKFLDNQADAEILPQEQQQQQQQHQKQQQHHQQQPKTTAVELGKPSTGKTPQVDRDYVRIEESLVIAETTIGNETDRKQKSKSAWFGGLWSR